MKHYLKNADDVLLAVQSGEDGLSSSVAAERLATNGKNKLVEAKKESLIRRFFKQLCEPMTIILLVAAAISAGVEIYEGIHSGHMGFPSDVVIILAVVLIVVISIFFCFSSNTFIFIFIFMFVMFYQITLLLYLVRGLL